MNQDMISKNVKYFSYVVFNNAITEKDLADIKKIGYIYKKY